MTAINPFQVKWLHLSEESTQSIHRFCWKENVFFFSHFCTISCWKSQNPWRTLSEVGQRFVIRLTQTSLVAPCPRYLTLSSTASSAIMQKKEDSTVKSLPFSIVSHINHKSKVNYTIFSSENKAYENMSVNYVMNIHPYWSQASDEQLQSDWLEENLR